MSVCIFVLYYCTLHIWREIKIIIRNTTKKKEKKDVCAQRRLRSAWVAVHSDQSFNCPRGGSLDRLLPFKRTSKTMIRLGECPGRSESSLGANAAFLFYRVAARVGRPQTSSSLPPPPPIPPSPPPPPPHPPLPPSPPPPPRNFYCWPSQGGSSVLVLW